MSDISAKGVIRKVVAKHKEQGKREIDAIDVYIETQLPIEQITRTLEALKKEGILSDG